MINILLIDWTKIDDNSATGNHKKILLELENVSIIHIYEQNILSKKILKIVDYKKNKEKILLSKIDLKEIITSYNIDILLIRPVEQSIMVNDLLSQLKEINKPSIFMLLDNWLNENIKDKFFFEDLIKKSTYVWSISDEMSEYLKAKYSVKNTVVVQNSISHNFQSINKIRNPKILIRYSGSLAKNMTHDMVNFFSKLDIANCKFEINSKLQWSLKSDISKNFFAKTYFDNYYDYLHWIKEADLLLLGYNFDKVSFDYIKYSFPNKLPEYLSTGNGILYIGPKNTSCYNFLQKHKIGFCFDKNKDDLVNFLNNYSVEQYQNYNKKNIEICNQEFSLEKNKSTIKKMLLECLH